MVTFNVNPIEGASEHIGAAPHTLRNLFIGLSLVAMVAILAVFYWHTAKEDSAAAKELSSFRQAMFNRCGGDQFAGTPEPLLVELYADSSRMRAVVVKQFHELQRPGTRCEAVSKALRGVDYPVR